jgi:biopolymer transport protein TolQ
MPIFTAAFFLFLQSDTGDAAAPVAAPGAHQAIMTMLNNIGMVAIAVLVVLAASSLYSWTVIFSKISRFKRVTSESKRFIRTFRKASRLQEIASITGDYKDSPLAQVFEDVYETYKRQTGGSGPPRSIVALERSAQTAASEAVTSLERRLTWLATIAAISPFVGLFGTVMGVVDAFQGLGTAGAATLRAVAPGISEALITTAAGLFVAIPAVVAYNQFASRIRVFASTIDDFSRELLNAMEEIQLRGAASGQAPQAAYNPPNAYPQPGSAQSYAPPPPAAPTQSYGLPRGPEPGRGSDGGRELPSRG